MTETEKIYVSDFNLYVVETTSKNGIEECYAADNSIIGATVIVHEKITPEKEITSIRKVDTNTVIAPRVRIEEDHKIFLANLEMEYTGKNVYVIASSLLVAAALLESYCESYYRVTNIKELASKKVFLPPEHLTE